MTLKTHKIILNVVCAVILAAILISALGVLLVLALKSAGHLPPSGIPTAVLIAVAGIPGVAGVSAGLFGFTRYCDWIRSEFALEEGNMSLSLW